MPTKTIIPATQQPRRRAEPPPLQARPRGFRLSDAFLQKLKMPEGRREVIQFEAGTGLGVRVSANGIFFIVQLPLPSGGRYRATLGAYGKLTVDDARRAVQAKAGDIARGVDPLMTRAGPCRRRPATSLGASTRASKHSQLRPRQRPQPRRPKSRNSPHASWSNDGGATRCRPGGPLTPCAPIAASIACSELCSIGRRPP